MRERMKRYGRTGSQVHLKLSTVVAGDPYGMLTSSAVAFHVPTSATQEQVPGLLGSNPACFSSLPVSFANWNPDTCCWKTSQRCLLGGLATYSGRWPRSGTMQSGTVYRLPALVPRISGTGFSSSRIPTPRNNESPTTTQRHMSVDGWVKQFPTPTSRDWKSGSANQVDKPRSEQLNDRVAAGGHGGLLNADWVSILQGFPADWTIVEDGNAESHAQQEDRKTGSQDLGASETQ